MRDDAIRPGPPPAIPAQADGITERAPLPVPPEVTLPNADVSLRADVVSSFWRRRLSTILLTGFPVFVVLCCYGIPLIQIQLRLSRNGALARQIIEALQQRFPGVKCTGGPSYENERVSITIWEGIDKAQRADVERWLRAHKAERRIAPEIWLSYGDDWNVPPIKF